MRQNTPRLWLLSASLPILVSSLNLISQPALAATESDTVEHQPNKTLQKPHTMGVYSSAAIPQQNNSMNAAKPHRLIQKRVKPEAHLDLNSHLPLTPLPLTPSHVPLSSTSSGSLDTQSLTNAAVPFTPKMAPNSYVQSTGTVAPPAKHASVEASAALHRPRTAASTLSDSTEVGEVPAPMRRLIFEMPKLTQLFNPPHSTQPPAIGASPLSFSFTAQQGSSAPATQALIIHNMGGGALKWTTADTTQWLTLSPASGTNTGTVVVAVNTGPLTVGTYTDTITVSATDAVPVAIPVTFTVTAAPVPPAIGASPLSVSLTAQQNSSTAVTQSVNISNTGGGTLTWTASETAPWLSVSPASGTGTGTITVSATAGSLSPGTLSASVNLSAPGAASKTIPVSFTVTAAPVPSAISITPSSLSFTATQSAANPATQTLSLKNSGGGTLTWSITDNQNWVTVGTTTGTTTTETDSVPISINTSGLQANTYTASITVTATGASNTPQTIPVTLTVNPPATSSATLHWDPNTEQDMAFYNVYVSKIQGTYGGAIATVPVGTVTYQATNLPVGNTYWFVVTAVDTQGNESTYSNEVSKSLP